jgi:tetratricopeptide (TPR) repeat protein
MARLRTLLLGLLLTGSGALAGPDPVRGIRDLHFGEALFHAHQGYYFEALARLDTELAQHYGLDEPRLDTLHHHIGHAEFFVGDFELFYRMHSRAGRAIAAVLEGDVDEGTRNEAAFRLARIHFQKDQHEEALAALGRIHGRVPERIRDELEFLRANVLLALGRPADAAVVLRRLQGSDALRAYSAYNLGVALLQAGRTDEALVQLDRAGQVRVTDPGTSSIRDKSNLVLGRLLFESNQMDRAQRSLERVRLEGPFSNRALLSAGWAAVSADDVERALVPWNLLVEREVTDEAVQEALLAVPYAYGRLNVHGRAALMYRRALDAFGDELDRLDASVRTIRAGKFLQALVREEIHQDRNWVVRLRALPEAPETYYLMSLLASHDFQQVLQNYLDLEDLRRKLASWHASLDAFDDIIARRRAYYSPLLPELDASFRTLDSVVRLRLEQREALAARLHRLLIAPRPELLATADERILLERLAMLEPAVDALPAGEGETLRDRIDRTRGAIVWHIHTEYHERLTMAHENLHALNVDVDAMAERYTSFVRIRQAAVHSYEGYEAPIAMLRQRVLAAERTVAGLMGRQGHLLELMAIRELDRRRERLERYQVHARFALADSFDRATAAQAAGAE